MVCDHAPGANLFCERLVELSSSFCGNRWVFFFGGILKEIGREKSFQRLSDSTAVLMFSCPNKSHSDTPAVPMLQLLCDRMNSLMEDVVNYAENQQNFITVKVIKCFSVCVCVCVSVCVHMCMSV